MVEAKCEPFVSIEWGMRIAVAEERMPIFKALGKIPPEAPLDQRDQQVLAVWNEKLLAECLEAEKWQPFYQMSVVRAARCSSGCKGRSTCATMRPFCNGPRNGVWPSIRFCRRRQPAEAIQGGSGSNWAGASRCLSGASKCQVKPRRRRNEETGRVER